jgi:hypothetical protein
MFGPGVDAAIEKYSAPDRELLAVLQLFGKDQRICHRYEIKEGPKVFETEVRGKKFVMYNDTVIGYAKDGTKIIETTVEEPLHIRPTNMPTPSEPAPRGEWAARTTDTSKRSVFGNYRADGAPSSPSSTCPEVDAPHEPGRRPALRSNLRLTSRWPARSSIAFSRRLTKTRCQKLALVDAGANHLCPARRQCLCRSIVLRSAETP